MKKIKMISIGALAEKTGVKVPTVRYYEKMGLIPEPARTEGNHRLYADDYVKRLMFIKRSRELGFELREVKQLLGLNDGLQPDCDQVKRITQEHLINVNSKIRDLQDIVEHLTSLSKRCASGSNVDCPIIESMYGDNL